MGSFADTIGFEGSLADSSMCWKNAITFKLHKYCTVYINRFCVLYIKSEKVCSKISVLNPTASYSTI